MPQSSIEYSANLADKFDPEALALRIHDLLPPLIDTEYSSCKTRLIELQRVVIADGSPEQAMVHVDLRILSGRSDEQKRAAGEAAMAALCEAVGSPVALDVQLSVEIRDLDGPNYHKRRVQG